VPGRNSVTHALYMDVHVPAAITAGLRQRGIDVLTCQEDGTIRLTDEEVLARATNLGRVLFTRDEDFLQIAGRWQTDQQAFFGVIYCHQLSAGIGQIINDLALISDVLGAEELGCGVVYLPL